MKKIVIIDSCEDCPHYDNEYYSYNEECTMLDRVVKTIDENGQIAIPEDCPLDDEKK